MNTMELLQPTPEEYRCITYDPTFDTFLKKDTLVLDPDKEIKGEGWTYVKTTPVQGKIVYFNAEIKDRNEKRLFYMTTTPAYRGLLKKYKQVTSTIEVGDYLERFNQTLIQFCSRLATEGHPLTLARYVQEEAYESFLDYLEKRKSQEDVQPD